MRGGLYYSECLYKENGDRRVFPFGSCINAKENIEADAASRRMLKDVERSLFHDAFQAMQNTSEQSIIVLFASRLYKKYTSLSPG